MVSEKQHVLHGIERHCHKIGMRFDSSGYVERIEDNLIQVFPNWDTILDELSRGQGNEVTAKVGKRPKFCSIHSSACLCVNNFALMKAHGNQVAFLGFELFSTGEFEKILPTGISSPNIDFYLENAQEVIGVESKFTEWLLPKRPNWIDGKTKIGNLQKYVNRAKDIKALPSGFVKEILEDYIEVNEKLHLDVSQLIKHALGLLRRAGENGGKKPILIYAYWAPTNADDLKAYIRHKKELADFSDRIDKYVKFRSFSYTDFWNMYDGHPLYSDCVGRLRARYQMEVR